MALTKNALLKLKKIHNLSSFVNSGNHRKKLLHLAKQHIIEIEYLYEKKDPHADIETGDLAVLCFEIILESNKNPDQVLEKCFLRYEKKLSELARQLKVQ
ncbi:MAG TPA: hypothetical protein PK303_07905 [bacterium]|nr:hypothetical protein [bacterium]HOL35655.1 hypothetical protein [bacterium]HPP09025.1 hypothetical protein [bacterium]